MKIFRFSINLAAFAMALLFVTLPSCGVDEEPLEKAEEEIVDNTDSEDEEKDESDEGDDEEEEEEDGDDEGDGEEEEEENDEDIGEYETCTDEGTNATRQTDISNPVNVGSIDDRSCYANYKEVTIYGKVWGVYNITDGSNHLDNNGLQPRIERSLGRSQTTGVGSFAKFTGTVRILEVGDTPSDGNDGSYIMQAKGKHTGGSGSADPAICLYLAKPVFGPDSLGNQVQVSFDVFREQINYRGGSGADGRDIIFLTNIKKNVATKIELEVGFRQDPNDASKKIHYADAIIGEESFNWNIPEPERGTQSGIRYGAYRVKGGRAQIRWADTTYKKEERN